MSTALDPTMKAWLDQTPTEELAAMVVWLQDDARSLYKAAAQYRDTPGKEWIAILVQNNAARSSGGARAGLEMLLDPARQTVLADAPTETQPSGEESRP